MATDPFASTPGSHVRYDDRDYSWREPAHLDQARALAAEHRRDDIDLFELRSGSETEHVAREMFLAEVRQAQHWVRHSVWTSSDAGRPPLPSPAPPTCLAEWSAALLTQYGVAVAYGRYQTNVAYTRRLSQAQAQAYAARRP